MPSAFPPALPNGSFSTSDQPRITVDEARELITRWQGGWIADALLGRIALKGVDLFGASAAVAYWMCPASRGRGLCPRAVVTLSEWAFAAGFHRLQLQHSTRNVASCRVATKAGFREEGTRRGAALHADGWHDMHAHARLSGDDRP